MKRSPQFLCLMLAAGLTIGLTQLSPVAAQDAAMKTMDCSKASSMMMMGPSSAMGDMKPSGDVDKDFMHSMMTHADAMMTMLKTEIACGKDAKTKEFAQKLLDQQRLDTEEARLLIGAGG